MLAAKIAIAISFLSSAVLSQPVAAQDWPKLPVRIVIPYPAGAGAADTLARQLGERLSQKWKQPVIIDNKPGAVEILATTAVAQAKPDGYTLLLSTDAALETNQFLFSKLPYDPSKDLTPITHLVDSPFIYVVKSDSPYRTMPELLAAAKAQPGRISYGSNGIGSNIHITVNWLAQSTGVEFLHVPYKGSVAILQDLLAGRVDFTPLPLAPMAGFVKENRVRVLATSGTSRLRVLPQVATLEELGYKDTDVKIMFALSGPANLPPAIANTIARDVAQVLKEPDFVATSLDPFGLVPVGNSPAEFARFLSVDREKQRVRVKAANVRLD
ncbi:tripartite tricarboxylate transporter substrate binding protein [Pigmentiphaga sp.]|uniref:Bug family tripartite tricarboxylate transporter substrate binding protein n=1 Tax=Pigmentiphaga sp. TaxID=1977564 RepID=UPI0025DAEA05|nr:tripartite tricarboxylate transporter substrate binding protein [Pigmentiphaga sp.]